MQNNSSVNNQVGIDDNAGVHANVGMDFQRNCGLYIFLENYHKLKNQRYFIILEHYEDIIFGFLNADSDLEKVESYQAKKSSKPWTNSELYEVVDKIVKNGIRILIDDLSKSDNYTKEHFFITNNTIKLTYKDSNNKKSTISINETNSSVHFLDLPYELRELLLNGSTSIRFNFQQELHFSTLNFSYIDFGRNTKSQLQLLLGKFEEVFGNLILDYKAARDTFLTELDKSDSVYNNGNQANLSDLNKRIESTKINEILDVITSEKLALEFCRNKSSEICKKLKINVIDSKYFELNFKNSLDNFKDLTQSEHIKILKYVNDNRGIFKNYYEDAKCIKALYEKFVIEKNTILNEIQLKATISAAYYLITTKL